MSSPEISHLASNTSTSWTVSTFATVSVCEETRRLGDDVTNERHTNPRALIVTKLKQEAWSDCLLTAITTEPSFGSVAVPDYMNSVPSLCNARKVSLS